MEKLEIFYLPVGELTPYEFNTRKHREEDIAQTAESIKRYGFNDPIAVWGEKNTIIEGHGRLMAAKSLGMTEVPVIRLDELTDEQRREYSIAHNRTAEFSEWDMEALRKELGELSFDGFDLNFDNFNMESETPEEQPEEDGGYLDTDETPAYKISYEIIFNNEEEQADWHKFLAKLRNAMPEYGTHSERILVVVHDWMAQNA